MGLEMILACVFICKQRRLASLCICTDSPEPPLLGNGICGSKKKYIFVVDEGWEDPNATISGPVNETPFKGRFAGVLMMA